MEDSYEESKARFFLISDSSSYSPLLESSFGVSSVFFFWSSSSSYTPFLRRYRAPASLFLLGFCYSLFVFFDNHLFYRYLASTSLLFQAIPPPILWIGTLVFFPLVFLFTADNALSGYLIVFFFPTSSVILSCVVAVVWNRGQVVFVGEIYHVNIRNSYV